jgi:hypothetical protein
MNQDDPTRLEVSTSNLGDREITVDEMQQIIATQAAASLAPEPTTVAAEVRVPEAGPQPLPLPTPLPLPKRLVSGRYRSPAAGFQVELRVDVDGTRPLNEVSGDFYQISGGTTTYFGSFVVKTPTLNVTATTVTVKGLGEFTFSAGAPVVQVTVPRVLIFTPPPNATLQFFTTAGAPGAVYSCAFESRFFRTVSYERGRASDVSSPEFLSYNTAAFPSAGANRILSVQKAYAEAGVEVQVLPEADLIDISDAGKDAQWSDSELEASMQLHFDQFRDVPQWKVWEMVCQLHELGPGLYGIMFDYQDAHQRQGCAVFHAGIGGITNDKLRLQLYTYVHELGHCFNLMHSWQKSLANPPGTDRPDSPSWMNYPWRFPGGEAAFWNAFAFQFDNGEIAHIRHAFRDQVIMGANAFGAGAALTDPRAFAAPVRDRSDLVFEIATPRSVLLGEPVVLRLNLKTTSGRGKTVHGYLHPTTGLVKIAIQKPGGEVHLFEPIMEHCVSGQQTFIDVSSAALQDSAYIGYGKRGLYFTQGGLYKIRATYYAADGSQVLSNLISMRVRNPATAEDENMADLLMGDEQGRLFALLGSDSTQLANGNKAFDEVLAKYPGHPLANYVRLVKGVNAGRDFKLVIPNKTKIDLRKADHQQTIEMMIALEKGAPEIGLDPITVNQARSYLSDSQKKIGDEAAAAATDKRKAASEKKAAAVGRSAA